MEKEYDLSGLICPLSKVKATEIMNNLGAGETAKLILGDTESLKSVAQELKTRGIKTAFEPAGDGRFILTITK